jgi:hypothetical protein
MRLAILPAIALASTLASTAHAKDVCVTDQTGREFRFENPKLPKKAGKVTAILGSARLVPATVDPFSFGPIHGSAMPLLGADDLFVVSLSGTTANIPFIVRANVDRDFAGNGVGAFGAGVALDTDFTWTAADCDASSLP